MFIWCIAKCDRKTIFFKELDRKMQQIITIKGQQYTYERLLQREIKGMENAILQDKIYRPFKYQLWKTGRPSNALKQGFISEMGFNNTVKRRFFEAKMKGKPVDHFETKVWQGEIKKKWLKINVFMKLSYDEMNRLFLEKDWKNKEKVYNKRKNVEKTLGDRITMSNWHFSESMKMSIRSPR